jgi:hypothetical protein
MDSIIHSFFDLILMTKRTSSIVMVPDVRTVARWGGGWMYRTGLRYATGRRDGAGVKDGRARG